MGYDTGQHILKMKDKTEELSPKNQELFAALISDIHMMKEFLALVQQVKNL